VSLLKTLLLIGVLVAASIYGLIKLREKGTATSILGGNDAPPARLSGEPAITSANKAEGREASAPAGAIALSDDPRRVAAPKSFVQPEALDPDLVKRYQVALEDIELDGCNANGSFAIRLRGAREPHLLRNGGLVDMPNGLHLTLRSHGYPSCKVVLYDGKNAIGEVAGF
jgi:hypothetical protein